MKAIATLHTDGSGCWSSEARAVEVTDIQIGYMSREQDFGEMRVYFNTDTWNPDDHGLIYTDDLFEKQLRNLLVEHAGWTPKEAAAVMYSEQGMQGDDYVSLDMIKEACDAWRRTHPAEFMWYLLHQS